MEALKSVAPLYAALVAGILALATQIYLNASKRRSVEAEEKLVSAKQFFLALEMHIAALRWQRDALGIFESHIKAAPVPAGSPAPSDPSFTGYNWYWEHDIVVQSENRVWVARQTVLDRSAQLASALLSFRLNFSPHVGELGEDLVLLSYALNTSPETAKRADEALSNSAERREKISRSLMRRTALEVKHANRLFRRQLKDSEARRSPGERTAAV